MIHVYMFEMISFDQEEKIISGRTSAAPVHQQYQQLLQQYQHPAAPTAFLQQQQQQQQAQAAAAAAAAVEHQMDNEVKTYVSVKADPIEPTRIKYTCNACQFSPKNIGYVHQHLQSLQQWCKFAVKSITKSIYIKSMSLT